MGSRGADCAGTHEIFKELVGSPHAEHLWRVREAGGAKMRNSRRQPLNRDILVVMEQFTLHIDNQGRVMLPAWWRKKEGIDPSTELCVAVTEEGALVVETRAQGLRRARALLRKYIPEGVNLSDELIADRRVEAARESGQHQ